MLFTLLVALISLLAILLLVIILIQSGKGGGLAASFGGTSSSTDSFMGGRQAATVLTKLTWIGGGTFLFLALVLAVLSSRTDAAPESILRQGLGGQTVLPEAPPSLLEGGLPPEPAPTGGQPSGGAGGEEGSSGTQGSSGDEGSSGTDGSSGSDGF